MYAGEVGVPRLLKLFNKYNIKATWFIPGPWPLAYPLSKTGLTDRNTCVGHSVETFPEQLAPIRDGGHEM